MHAACFYRYVRRNTHERGLCTCVWFWIPTGMQLRLDCVEETYTVLADGEVVAEK